ncbi:potassium/proton antiporter [Acholeplasma oculi]|uniref:Na(+)/H(+) antiporter n=1 Tax=Acholeplasma oculi TaxID=35623 RepID=A0A061A8Z2_9MOLU|nr:cation:proton antiporter [Acholeplasma oculi]CDR30313.1 Na(+)/H(+) antiporter [Acholeplasma oculi]SKC43041.1 NhaP-type Na+/H+ or K+/H+ antiporter [Acholeplasma oculi]SUT88778.1 potassium/proton antiporter [Acholeplasma oculi]
MLLTLSLIILVGFSLSEIFYRLKLPRIIGMILAGILLGPYVFNLIAPEVLAISVDLRQIALIIILLRAGLSLSFNDLKKVGRPAILMSFIPASLEIIGVLILGPIFLGLTVIESLVLGSILAAVSPAIVVPRMLKLMEDKQGTKKSIPQIVLAGASVDDIFVIVLFTSFVQVAQTGSYSLLSILFLPISIVLGILVGIIFGYLFVIFFKKFHIRDTTKILLILSFSLFFLTIEHEFSNIVPYSGLLSALSMGITILTRYQVVAERLVKKYEKIWVFTEMLLFVLVGAAVDITQIPNIGLMAILLIIGALVFRSIGVFISLYKTNLEIKERTFVAYAYIPKATVQASIGSIPLALGISNGNTMLTIAVLAILLTAPLGAFLIDLSKNKFLGPKDIEDIQPINL